MTTPEITKQHIKNWLRAKPRTEDEIVDKIIEVMNTTYDMAMQRKAENNEIRTFLLKQIFAPIRTGYE